MPVRDQHELSLSLLCTDILISWICSLTQHNNSKISLNYQEACLQFSSESLRVDTIEHWENKQLRFKQTNQKINNLLKSIERKKINNLMKKDRKKNLWSHNDELRSSQEKDDGETGGEKRSPKHGWTLANNRKKKILLNATGTLLNLPKPSLKMLQKVSSSRAGKHEFVDGGFRADWPCKGS